MKSEVRIPLITTNRINMPEVAERILAAGQADMVSMARPLLADPDWVRKAEADRSADINTCIACNQACLDHVFEKKRASCLVNPRACHETELVIRPTDAPKRVAVIGAGPAGLAFATTAAERGHKVTLLDQNDRIGGQFNLAKRIPGKEEFHETLRYFERRLAQTGVDVKLGQRADAATLADGFDEVVMATGVTPRDVRIPGHDHAKVIGYIDALTSAKPVGHRVAIIGAGGIGFDVAEFLVHAGPSPSLDPQLWMREWGVDPTAEARGAVEGMHAAPEPPAREIWLMQRSEGKPGKRLNKTSGWVHRATLKMKGVHQWGGVEYQRIDDEGLHIHHDGEDKCLPVDTVVICAGQEPNRELEDSLVAAGLKVSRIGGADVASELDAKRAIDQGTRLAASL